MKLENWVVHKFGGTSVANATRYQEVVKILESEPGDRKAVVVSAMSGVTNSLIELTELAQRRDETYVKKLSELKLKHLKVVDELLPSDRSSGLKAIIETDFHEIAEVLRGIFLIRTASERTVDLISGYGEIWSAQCLNAFLQFHGKNSLWLDARQILVVTPSETHVNVDWTQSKSKLEQWLKGPKCDWIVITGFIASTPDGIATTLRRNGSDYSASIFASLLKAQSVTIWKEVDGVMSADPRFVPDAVVLNEMSYSEASEFAYFGAKVVHPSTMAPVIEDQIPVWIRNSFNPSHPGTLIHAYPEPSPQPIKGFSAIDGIAVINVEGTGMIGVPGVAQRLFGGLKEVGISVIMISQASSEHSICFAISESQVELARKTVEQSFYAELHQGQIQAVSITLNCSILAAVGENMAQHPGVAGQFFTALGNANINVRAIAQGSSEKNISVVIDRQDTHRALRTVHSAFYLSNQTLSIGLIGTGLIGHALLQQLRTETERLKNEFKIDLRIRGLANSKKMMLVKDQINLTLWEEMFSKDAVDLNVETFSKHIYTDHLPHAVIIDCTASLEIAKNYADWLEMGIHVITPNKKANSESMDVYQHLRSIARSRNRHFLYQTNVGGGLPIISTLRDLVKTGDRIELIEGVFSGTLSYLFNHFSSQMSFSELVKAAQEKGYTEPDPREDLSGIDVARKLVILAREMGFSMELNEISVESLVPYSDEQLSRLLKVAQEKNEVLRYVGSIGANGKATVGLKSYPSSHSFARLQGNDNIVAFKTARYHTQPLIIQGPGAGPEVTAAGVFADLLRLASYVGASS